MLRSVACGLVFEGMISWGVGVICDSGAIDKTAFRSAKMRAFVPSRPQNQHNSALFLAVGRYHFIAAT